jgi:hypothetical protein
MVGNPASNMSRAILCGNCTRMIGKHDRNTRALAKKGEVVVLLDSFLFAVCFLQMSLPKYAQLFFLSLSSNTPPTPHETRILSIQFVCSENAVTEGNVSYDHIAQRMIINKFQRVVVAGVLCSRERS